MQQTAYLVIFFLFKILHYFLKNLPFNFVIFLKFSSRITKDENYDHSQVSIHSGKHKDHLHNKSSTFFDKLIRYLKSKLLPWTNGNYFIHKLGETFDKWYISTIFDPNLLNHRLCQQYHWKILIKICNFECLSNFLLKSGFKTIFSKSPHSIFQKLTFSWSGKCALSY